MINFLAVFLLGSVTGAQVQSYSPELARKKIEASLSQVLINKVSVAGGPADERTQAYLEHFQTSVVPLLNRFASADGRQSAYGVLIDSASYKDNADKSELTKKLNQAGADVSAYQVDPAATATFEKSAALSEGLTGELPEFSRRQARERKLNAFSKTEESQLLELQNIETSYQAALNEAPANGEVGMLMQGLARLRQRYAKGEMSLKDAMKESDELLIKAGDHRVGFQAVQSVGSAQLNHAAVIRSRLAKSKGFATWAQYKVETNGQGYDKAFRGVKNQKAFLKTYLKKRSQEQRALIRERLKELKAAGTQLKAHHLGFLNRPDLMTLLPYFPDPTEVWQKVLNESGFDSATMRQILLDDQPRANKYGGGAFMLPIAAPAGGVLNIDAKSLKVGLQPPLIPGLVYVLQNYRQGGVRDLKTVLHEGMHALNFLLSGQVLPVSETYGYLETPSTTAEHFTRDAEVLFNNMSGPSPKPSRAEVETFVQNQIKNDSLNLWTNAENALFDIELWDYDYAAPKAKTFMQRVQDTDAELFKLTQMPKNLKMAEPYWYTRLSTDHFVFGKVQYIGYVYADLAAKLMVDHITEELKKTTGRPSWHNQPTLAKIFTEQLFRRGWQQPFPTSIEKITCTKFQ